MMTSEVLVSRAASAITIVACLTLLHAPLAHAQSPDAAAEAAFQQGRRLMAEKRFAEACDAFAESQRIQKATGTLYNLALCNEELDRTATAWSQFKTVESESNAPGAVRPERAHAAAEHIAALEPRLSRIVLDVAGGGSVTIDVDGLVLGPPLWRAGVVVDPGRHVVRATAPDKKTWETTVEIRGDAAREVVKVPRLEPMPASKPAPVAEHHEPPPPRSAVSPLGLTLGGAGLVALGVGGVTGLLALDRANAVADCHPCIANSTAHDEAQKAYDSGKVFATVANVAIPVGVVLTAAGVYLIFHARAKASSAFAEPGVVRW
jgi:hypothetical protein